MNKFTGLLLTASLSLGLLGCDGSIDDNIDPVPPNRHRRHQHYLLMCVI